MARTWRVLLLCTVVWTLALAQVYAAGTPYMSVKDVHPGMRGIGKTVVEGTKIEDFFVEVLGVVHGQSPTENLILIKTSGELIEGTGGIAAGMSGSPVYIDGRLLGAVGYGFDSADHTIGFVTPIEEMAQVLDLVQPKASEVDRDLSAGLDFRSDRSIRVGEREISRVVLAPAVDRVADDTLVLTPVQTPLLVSGLGQRTFAQLNGLVQPLNLMPMQAGGHMTGVSVPDGLEPGSAFGVQLVRGDVDVTAIGTITDVREKAFIGFGHPFLNRGPVDFFVTDAYIFRTIQSIKAPFKLGAPGSVVGRLTQDRGAAVGGELGTKPRVVPLRVTVQDEDLNRKREFSVELTKDDLLMVPLTAISGLEALDRSLDRLGPGTSRVVMRIEGEGLPKKIIRDNMFYSGYDIAAVSIGEFLNGMDMLINNPFQGIGLTRVDLDVTVQERRQTATIEKATPAIDQVMPGGTFDIEVLIRPFRGRPETKVLRMTVPEGTQPGDVSVTVRSGSWGIPTPAYGEPSLDLGATPKEGEGDQQDNLPLTGAESLEKMIDEFLDREKNNDLVAEFYPYYGPPADMQPAPEAASKDAGDRAVKETEGEAAGKAELPPEDLGNDSELSEPVTVKLLTPYVIRGSSHFAITILSPPDDAAPTADIVE